MWITIPHNPLDLYFKSAILIGVMKKITYMATAFILVVGFTAMATYRNVYATPTPLEENSEEPAEQVEVISKIEPKTIPEIIKEKAEKYNQNYTTLSKVIFCESSFQTTVSHDGGRGKGVTGFHKDTFNRWLKVYMKETNQTLNYDSNYDQIELMSWAFSKGENYRNDWTSYNKLVRYGECNNGKLIKMGITNINIQPN